MIAGIRTKRGSILERCTHVKHTTMNQTAQHPLILEAADLKSLIGQPNILLLDLCQTEHYVRQHIPGAIFMEYAWVVHGEKPRMGLLPDAQRLSALLSAYGISDNTHVIAYDDEGGGRACRLLWTLDCVGHTRYSLLNGGFYAWAHEGHATEQTIHFPTPTQRTVQISDGPIADQAYIRAHLDDPSTVILDARSAQEYMGTKVFAARGGHIPGAVHFEWTNAMDQHRSLRIKPAEELTPLLQREGITPDKTIVCHCQSHHRSAHTYIVLKSLGYDKVKGYPGSWSDWGNTPDTPIEQ